LNTLTFDIETIPQQETLSDIQQLELEKQLEKTYSRNPDWDDKEKEKFKRLIMATNPFYGEIICIGMHMTTGNMFDSKALIGEEFHILERFWKVLADFKGLFISFNGMNFDIPFILKRSMKYQIIPTNNDFLNLRRFSTHPHFDTKLVIGDWDKYATGTLRLVCNHLGIQSPKEGEVKAENVENEFKMGNIQDIADYCLKDVEATYAVYEKLSGFQHQHHNKF
jgi:predicted PolB exonuclease-like 3'-5' exonuclease